MDDIYSDVMKTAGMTHKELEGLNEAFKKIDTRTSREELNSLARDAGKLGLSAKKDILDFVETGNQVNVAPGKDPFTGRMGGITTRPASIATYTVAVKAHNALTVIGNTLSELCV